MARNRKHDRAIIRDAAGAGDGRDGNWVVYALCLLLAAMVIVAYWNSFDGVFVLDDNMNAFAGQWFNSQVLLGRMRPVVELTLGLNSWQSGGVAQKGMVAGWWFHTTNLAIHIAAALTLLGLVRRTVLLASPAGPLRRGALYVAAVAAGLWALHPVNTSAVTYIVQRSESLMALMYLLVLYCVARMAGSRRRAMWGSLAVAACAVGMGAKQVMVTAPLMALIYDRTFISSSWRAVFAGSKRWLYLGLAGTWMILAGLVWAVPVGKSAGFGMTDITPCQYALTQAGVLVRYLKISFYPSDLVLDYGWPITRHAGEVLLPALLIVPLLALTALALWRWPRWGFLGLWFFLVLAPTSSVMPIADAAFDYRMYLPLAGGVVLVVVGCYYLGEWCLGHGTQIQDRGRLSLAAFGLAAVAVLCIILSWLTIERNRVFHSVESVWLAGVVVVVVVGCYCLGKWLLGRGTRIQDRRRLILAVFGLAAVAVLCVVLGWLTIERNRVFHSVESVWRDALAKYSRNSRAWCNLGVICRSRGEHEQAVRYYLRAIEGKPDNAGAHNDAGTEYLAIGQVSPAIPHFTKAIELDPTYADPHSNLANVLASLGRYEEAAGHYQQALAIEPAFADAAMNYAWLLATCPEGHVRDAGKAVALARRACEASSYRDAGMLNVLGAAYAEAGDFARATACAHQALALARQEGDQQTIGQINRCMGFYSQSQPVR